MPIQSKKLQTLADDILRSLDRLDGDTPQVAAVRGHVLALAALLGADRDVRSSLSPEAAERTRDDRITEERHVRGFKATTIPPRHDTTPAPTPEGARPHATERRLARMSAGVTLKQVSQAAGTTMTTTRMYENRRLAVRPDKRADLDRVYDGFPKKDQIK